MRLLLFALTLTPASAQWQLQTSNTAASLRGIHAVSDQIAWASGTAGTILHTTDGGQHWLPCTTPPAAEHLDFRGIQAFDAQTAIVMSSGKGDLSRLYKTTDACQSWHLVFTNPDKEGFWDAIRFSEYRVRKPDSCFGEIIGDPVHSRFPIFLSVNCGDSWERQLRESPPALSEEGLFAASNSSLLVSAPGSRSFVTGGSPGARVINFWVGVEDFSDLKTDPSNVLPGAPEFHPLAREWRVEPLMQKESNAASGAFSIAADGSGWPAVIVGGDYRHAEIGSSWCRCVDYPSYSLWHQSHIPPHGFRSAVAYSPTHKAWITVGPNGTDLSTDDGRNWRALRPTASEDADSDKNWNALSLPFVVGPNGRIGRLRPTALP